MEKPFYQHIWKNVGKQWFSVYQSEAGFCVGASAKKLKNKGNQRDGNKSLKHKEQNLNQSKVWR